ncbi:hypothetical protein NLG97_g9030 [Lecanicillium saksenae]|uniref:Uncharacterized protein n=1 Tax=Lecanicillium saksenae TaxID=468837 RepID=A0ACC1QH62_9HYPO|nr:hypothetical protein NLG97_g9030 [Lecanicillium saksenae]
MDEIYEKLAIAGQLATSADESALEFDDSARVCEVYEVWSHNGSQNVEHGFRKIYSAEVPDWLQNGGRPEAKPGCTLLLRLVLVTIRPTEDPKKKAVSVTKTVHGQLLEAFGLKLANEYFKSTITSVTSFPSVSLASGAERYCYAFNHAPKLAAIWSQDRYTSNEKGPDIRDAIQGNIYITEDAVSQDSITEKPAKNPSEDGITPSGVLRQLLNSPFCADLYTNSMAPALLLAMQLGFEIDATQSRIKSGIRIVEGKTGYHTFKSREAASTTQEKLGQLAVQASGSATKLASIDRKSISMQKILEFILKELDAQQSIGADAAARRAEALLRHHVAVLENRLEMQMLDTRYTMKRVDIQINAIFNMMTQEDTLNGIELAKSTHQIAHASYRDSSSMKTLAIVTMFFLPGSFVSALFSMPMFKWDKVDADSRSIGVGLLPQFSLYWAITLPLTVVTFVLYFMWLWQLKRERDQGFDRVSRKSVDNSDGEEGGDIVQERRLARKRRETTL